MTNVEHTSDRVAVVFCRDCKYAHMTYAGEVKYCDRMSIYLPGDWFCADGERRYDDGFEDGVMFISERIDSAPTIDAIPVEWLQNEMNMADDRGDMDMTDAISWLIQEWQKEQEAKNEYE